VHAIGVDIIEIIRIAQALDRWDDRFLSRTYTQGELAYCKKRPPQLASRFAAKEAAMKALGTGRHGVNWRDIEVVRRKGGPPTIVLHNRALKVAAQLGVRHIAVSLSHSREYAVASVLIEIGLST
jgi:holo-[acyl-carrier protein] synthase